MQKWTAIGIIGFFLVMGAGGAWEQQQKKECRISYANSSRSAEEINKICK